MILDELVPAHVPHILKTGLRDLADDLPIQGHLLDEPVPTQAPLDCVADQVLKNWQQCPSQALNGVPPEGFHLHSFSTTDRRGHIAF